MRAPTRILATALLLGLLPHAGAEETGSEALGERLEELEAVSRSGVVDELRTGLQELAAEIEQGEPEQVARFELLRAREQTLSGEREQALETLEALLEKPLPETLRLQAYSLAANTALVERFYTRAFEYLLPGLELLDEVDDPAARADILGRAAYVYERLGDHDNALRFGESAVAAARDTEDARELCVEGHQLGVVERDAGLHARAALTLEEARLACEAVDDRIFLGLVLNSLSEQHLVFDDPERARELAEAALKHYEQAGYAPVAVAATIALAEATLRQGNPDDALDKLAELYTDYAEDFSISEEGTYWQLVAVAREARGDYAEALEANREADRAWEIYRERTHRLRRAQAEVQFEMARQEQQLRVAEERSRRNEVLRNAAVGGGVTLMLLILVVISRYYTQIRANRAIARKNEELATLNHIISAINSREDFHDVMAVLMQQAVEMLPEAERGIILVRDLDSGYFRVAGHYAAGQKQSTDLPDYPDTELTASLAVPRYTERGRELTEGVFLHEGFRPTMDHELLAGAGQSLDLVAMVLPVQDQVEGFLLLASAHDQHPVDPDHARRLERIREHAIAAITRARHLEVVRRENRRAEAALDNLRSAHEQLKQALGDAERANTAKTEFLARASHELRTPLNTIIGYSQKLARRLEQEGIDDTVPEAHSIRESGRHLLTIIEEVLNLSRAESGDAEINYEQISLSRLLHEIAETMRPQIEERGNRLELQCDPELGPLHSDPVKLRQILFNLLDNANKFTDQGTIRLIGEPGTASATPEDSSEHALRIRVIDTGVGMDPQEMERVFNPFTQGNDDIARAYGGSGLGLAVSRSLAELLGGSLEVESEPGRGSDFQLLLPRHVLPLMEVEVSDQPSAPTEVHTRSSLRGVHVLIIEDNRINREMLAEYLELEGMHVTHAGDAPEGLTKAREEQPDLILMDLSLPSMSGSEATLELRQDPLIQAIPVIAVSAYATREAEQRSLEMGCDAFETKPVDFPRLMEKMHGLLQKH